MLFVACQLILTGFGGGSDDTFSQAGFRLSLSDNLSCSAKFRRPSEREPRLFKGGPSSSRPVDMSSSSSSSCTILHLRVLCKNSCKPSQSIVTHLPEVHHQGCEER